MATKIHTVLAAVGEHTTVAEIEQDTGFDMHYIRNALRMLRAYGQVVRDDEGRPRCEAAHFSITQAGRDVLAEAEPVALVKLPASVPLVHQAISQRPFLATMWAAS